VDTVVVPLTPEVLHAADQAARSENIDRVEFIQRAVEERIKRFERQEAEERERRAYMEQPQTEDEYLPWEKVTVWPED